MKARADSYLLFILDFLVRTVIGEMFKRIAALSSRFLRCPSSTSSSQHSRRSISFWVNDAKCSFTGLHRALRLEMYSVLELQNILKMSDSAGFQRNRTKTSEYSLV